LDRLSQLLVSKGFAQTTACAYILGLSDDIEVRKIDSDVGRGFAAMGFMMD
jgi:hypothetical protein